MAQKGLFFNAFPDSAYDTGYDRNYSADDISDWLSIVCSSGVVKTDNEEGSGIPQGLKVVAAEGLTIGVNSGKATIRGKGYINDSLLTLPIETAPTGSSPRYDLVVLRCDNTQSVEARKNYVLVITGTSSVPTVSDLTRDSNIYDLLLGYVVVRPNATSIQQSDIVDTRGDETLCPYFTAVKGYDDYYDAIIQRFESDTTLSASSDNVVTDLASNLYNNKYSLINVYVNGLKEESDNYTIDVTNQFIKIIFTSVKNAGADVSVVLNNFVDGEGLSTAIEEYNQFVQDVADLQTLKEFNYYCNGVTDNVEISNFVNALISDASQNETIKINIIGTFGMTAAAQGSGTSANPYKIFSFNDNSKNVRFSLDFTHCKDLEITVTSGATTNIFDGYKGQVIGATIIVNNTVANTIVRAFGEQYWSVINSRFNINSNTSSILATYGEFIDCKGIIVNTNNTKSYVFYPKSNGILRVRGGEYRAYALNGSNSISAVFGLRNSCFVYAENVNCPTVRNGNYVQTNSIYHDNGSLTCIGLISPLTPYSTTGYIVGTIAANFDNQVW